ncbi:MAG: hypothetical protein JXB05_12485 [Myxococcaceae bacterium]|nr:hypothetical protein [Myxococcaceae bacterium]
MVDPAVVRSLLIRCLEQLEQQDRATGESVSTDRYEHLLEKWQTGDAVVRFARRMRQLLREGLSQGASAQEIDAQIEVALARRLGLQAEFPSFVRTLELHRLCSRISSR